MLKTLRKENYYLFYFKSKKIFFLNEYFDNHYVNKLFNSYSGHRFFLSSVIYS